MNIPPGSLPPPATGGSAARSAPPPPGASGPKETAAPPPPPKAAAPVQAPLSSEAVQKVAQQINEFLKSSSSSLQFTVDGETNKVVVRIVDAETKELIRQMPSEEMIAISKSLDQLRGLLIQQKA